MFEAYNSCLKLNMHMIIQFIIFFVLWPKMHEINWIKLTAYGNWRLATSKWWSGTTISFPSLNSFLGYWNISLFVLHPVWLFKLFLWYIWVLYFTLKVFPTELNKCLCKAKFLFHKSVVLFVVWIGGVIYSFRACYCQSPSQT